MSALETVKEARNKMEQAQTSLRNASKGAIREGLDVVFADSTVKAVAFAQKSGEYNDEGMYPGVFGPQVFEGDVNFDRLMEDRWESFDDLLGYGNLAKDSRATQLETALNTIGEDILSDLFGEECVVFVTKDPNGYNFESEYVGY